MFQFWYVYEEYFRFYNILKIPYGDFYVKFEITFVFFISKVQHAILVIFHMNNNFCTIFKGFGHENKVPQNKRDFRGQNRKTVF